jgi:hypothetical protein
MSEQVTMDIARNPFWCSTFPFESHIQQAQGLRDFHGHQNLLTDIISTVQLSPPQALPTLELFRAKRNLKVAYIRPWFSRCTLVHYFITRKLKEFCICASSVQMRFHQSLHCLDGCQNNELIISIHQPFNVSFSCCSPHLRHPLNSSLQSIEHWTTSCFLQGFTNLCKTTLKLDNTTIMNHQK